MELSFLNNKLLDDEFIVISKKLLIQIEAENSKSDLNKISFAKLAQLMHTLNDYRPKSHIRKEKQHFIKYLYSFTTNPISRYSDKELMELKVKYIFNTTGNKLRSKGYTTKGGWIGGLIFILPIDILFWFFVGKYYYYIPIVSIPFMIIQLRKEIKAKAENKLW